MGGVHHWVDVPRMHPVEALGVDRPHVDRHLLRLVLGRHRACAPFHRKFGAELVLPRPLAARRRLGGADSHTARDQWPQAACEALVLGVALLRSGFGLLHRSRAHPPPGFGRPCRRGDHLLAGGVGRLCGCTRGRRCTRRLRLRLLPLEPPAEDLPARPYSRVAGCRGADLALVLGWVHHRDREGSGHALLLLHAGDGAAVGAVQGAPRDE
mmetsp:Transcript_67927/g.196695  ORF Transcript_67927/g.196695 Transcript_67927/m.196695 type:complete len:211 (+) Transcript_67927:225-857(+)